MYKRQRKHTGADDGRDADADHTGLQRGQVPDLVVQRVVLLDQKLRLLVQPFAVVRHLHFFAHQAEQLHTDVYKRQVLPQIGDSLFLLAGRIPSYLDNLSVLMQNSRLDELGLDKVLGSYQELLERCV